MIKSNVGNPKNLRASLKKTAKKTKFVNIFPGWTVKDLISNEVIIDDTRIDEQSTTVKGIIPFKKRVIQEI